MTELASIPEVSGAARACGGHPPSRGASANKAAIARTNRRRRWSPHPCHGGCSCISCPPMVIDEVMSAMASSATDRRIRGFRRGCVVNDASAWGRPVGVTVTPDGALYVSDDAGGTIWRITATGRRHRQFPENNEITRSFDRLPRRACPRQTVKQSQCAADKFPVGRNSETIHRNSQKIRCIGGKMHLGTGNRGNHASHSKGCFRFFPTRCRQHTKATLSKRD